MTSLCAMGQGATPRPCCLSAAQRPFVDGDRHPADVQGISGSSTEGRSGFAELAAQVGLGQVSIVLALEVSRPARNNADWYRLLDLAGMTDTLIADAAPAASRWTTARTGSPTATARRCAAPTLAWPSSRWR